MRVRLAAALSLSILAAGLGAQPPSSLAMRAARLIDGRSETVRLNAVVLVEGERIVAVGGPELLTAGAGQR
jgi:hypothetical protein